MMQGVSLQPGSPAALPARWAAPARPAGSEPFTPPGAATASPTGDVIDVEVLWEEADGAPDVSWRRTPAPRPSHAPLRITHPADAIAAYRSASSTAALPHTLVDLFA
jgi:hypothetical protein